MLLQFRRWLTWSSVEGVGWDLEGELIEEKPKMDTVPIRLVTHKVITLIRIYHH